MAISIPSLFFLCLSFFIILRADKAPEEITSETLKSLQNSISNIDAKSTIHEAKFNELTNYVKALSEFCHTREQQTQAIIILNIYEDMKNNPDLSKEVKQECRKLAIAQLSKLVKASPTTAIIACSALHKLNTHEELPDSTDLAVCREIAQKLNSDFNKNIEHNS
jgi:hypothetical protein